MKILVEDLYELYYQKGLILKEIAKLYKTSESQLRKVMKRHNMAIMRGPAKYRKLIVQKSNLPLSLDETDIRQYINQDIPNQSLEVLLGAMIGDSSISVRFNKYDCSFNISLGHSVKQLDYLKYKHELIGSDWCNPIRKERDASQQLINGKIYNVKDFYAFTTKSLKIDYIYRLLFEKPEKGINRKYLSYLTPLSLAIWYMDDGSYSYDNRIIRISTMCYTKEENELIRDYFYEDLKMPCIVEKADSGTGWSISLPQNSTKKFLAIIRPYMCNCVNYKFPKNPSETLKTNNLYNFANIGFANKDIVSKGVKTTLNNAEHPL